MHRADYNPFYLVKSAVVTASIQASRHVPSVADAVE
jgi:hypothetical protein